MLANLKRLPALPQLPHPTGEPRTWSAPPQVLLPPRPSPADPETAPGGGGRDASDAGDPAAEDEGSALHNPGGGASSTPCESDSPSGSADGVAATGSRCAARNASARTAASCARVLRAMPEEKPGSEGRAQGEPP